MKKLYLMLLVPLLFSPLSGAHANDYYEKFTPNLFDEYDSPLTVHAAYYNQNSGATNWTLLVTYKDGFITKTTKEEYEKTPTPSKPTCTFSTFRYNENEIFAQDYIDTGHRSFSVADMGYFVIKKFEDDGVKIFAGPTSAVFHLQCNRTGNEIIPKNIKRFFKKMKDGLALICPQKSTLSDWTTDFESLKPFLDMGEHRHCMYLTEGPYAAYFTKK